jgi:hypothetical protein
LNPQQLKVNTMNETEMHFANRAVEALEAIAEHMGVLATMALTSQVPAAEKRPRGRPRKDAQVHIVGGTDTVQAAAPAPAASPAPVEPSEEERKAKFEALKAALKGALALHGEEATRERLRFPKFSEVPFDAIDATIERLSA